MATQPKVILVVDDDASMLKSVTRLLKVHGFVTQTFSSAEELLNRGGTSDATCLLLDIHLGGISGIELHRRLAAAGSRLPIIFMTAIDDESVRQEAIDAGCVAYLRKPFGVNLLLDAIGKAVA
jgi:FixJ family two-component response regulator